MNDSPQLQPPGAGLPRIELAGARVLLGVQRRFVSLEKSTRLFQKERAELLRLARSCGAGDGARPVLIRRLVGMEDSSRNWSVFMTLHHLQIVNAAFTGIIKSLCNDVEVEGVASTADVKPDPATDASMIEQFDQTCAEYVSVVNECGDLRSRLTFLHPWFGEMNALGWHTLAAIHMSIHRKQVELILAGSTVG